MPRRSEKVHKKHILTVRVKRPKKKAAEKKISAQNQEMIEEILAREQEMRTAAEVSSPVVKDTEREKKLIMWSGVVFFMLLIFVVWAFNIRKEFTKMSTANKNSNSDWATISQDLKDKLDEMNKNLSEIKNFGASALNATSTDLTATSSTATSSSTDAVYSGALPVAETKTDSIRPATTTAQEIEKLKTELGKVKFNR